MITVAVVDDQAVLLMLAMEELKTVGDVVVVAFMDGKSAEAWTGWDDVDIVIADFMLNALERGDEVISRLKTKYPHLYAVLISATEPREYDRAVDEFINRSSLHCISRVVNLWRARNSD